jgi:hypothetical protein
MLNLFLGKKKGFELNTPIKQYSKFDMIRDKYKYELEKIKEYYRNRDRAVDNQNVFAKLLTILTPNIEIDLIDYLKGVESNAIYFSKQFDFVSNISKGKLLENNFYFYNSKELLLYIENDIDIFTVANKWKEIESVKVVYTENTAIDFEILFGNKELPNEKLTMFEVNVVLMALQYKYWALERKKNDMSTNPNVFVARVILPNLLDNMLDLVIFNRFLELYQYGSIDEFEIDHPFAVSDYSNKLDKVLKDVLKDTVNNSIPIEQFINTIPTIANDCMLDVLKINKPFYTKQSEWALWVGRIKYIALILEMMGERGRARNRDYINYLPSRIRALENRSTEVRDQLSSDMLLDFEYQIEKIKNMLGRR